MPYYVVLSDDGSTQSLCNVSGSKQIVSRRAAVEFILRERAAHPRVSYLLHILKTDQLRERERDARS